MLIVKCLKIIKLKFKNFFNLFFSCLYPLPKNPTVVICMDGGLCSQMFDYLIGEYFRINGYTVLFDLNWFDEDGLDVLRKNKRYFEINKLYPDLYITKASKRLINAYKLRCRTKESDLKKVVDTKCNYYIVNDHPLIINSKTKNELFHQLFDKPLIPSNLYIKKWLKEINSVQETCSVHIRRGDLAIESVAVKSGYGHVCKDSYIINAMNIINKLKSNIAFFIFSDEIEYVKENILPQCKKNNLNVNVVTDEKNANLEGGGINDFFLISKCKHNIATLGSFGYIAAKINNNTDKILITLSKDVEDFSNYVILDTEGNFIDSSITEI